MKKLILLCAVLSTSLLYSMETELFSYCKNTFTHRYTITHAYYYLYSLFFTPESKPVQEMKKDKKEFEQKLHFECFVKEENISMQAIVGFNHSIKEMFAHFFQSPTTLEPINFLRYCFYQMHFTDQNKQEMKQLVHAYPSHHPLDKYKKTELSGYSAIGAAIVAPYVSLEIKREFIQQLFDFGFQPTNKDIMLAELTLYDAIPAGEKTKMILFLKQKDLLPEIKKKVLACIVQLYRKDFWLLPETADDKK